MEDGPWQDPRLHAVTTAARVVPHSPDTIGFADVTEATAGASSWWISIGYIVGAVFALNLLLCIQPAARPARESVIWHNSPATGVIFHDVACEFTEEM